jgi:hypothetical protein
VLKRATLEVTAHYKVVHEIPQVHNKFNLMRVPKISLGDQHDDGNEEDAGPLAHMTLTNEQIEQFDQVLANYLELDENANDQAEENSADNTDTSDGDEEPTVAQVANLERCE